jgi:hypothetical protein
MRRFVRAVKSFPGIVGRSVTGSQLLQAWGNICDVAQDGVFSALTNRFVGYETDPSATWREFGLPQDRRLNAIRWPSWVTAGTKQGLFYMLNAIGHGSASVFNSGGRYDSPYMSSAISAVLGTIAPTSLLPRYLTIGAGNGRTSITSQWFTVVVWDGVNGNGTSATPYTFPSGLNAYLGSFSSGFTGPIVPWAYGGQLDTDVIEQVCRFNTCAGELCLEVFVGYYNSTKPAYSSLDQYGNFATTGDNWSVSRLDYGQEKYQ